MSSFFKQINIIGLKVLIISSGRISSNNISVHLLFYSLQIKQFGNKCNFKNCHNLNFIGKCYKVTEKGNIFI